MTLPVDATLDLQSVNKIINLPTPTAGGDAVPKSYADAIAQGIIFKDAVQGSSTEDVAVNSPGAIGTVATGERVLLTGQTTATEDGLYIFNGNTTPLTRAPDFASGSVEAPGTAVFDESSGFLWVMNTTAPVTVDTTAQTWTTAGAAGNYTFQAPITNNSGTIGLNNGSPLPLANGGTGAANAAGARANLLATGKYATTIGDGTDTSFVVTHNLGTTDVTVNVYDMATGNLELAQVSITSNNSVTVSFGSAPTASGGSIGSGTGKRVVVVG